MIWVLLQLSESPWQCNDTITFFIDLCVSLYQECLRKRLRDYVPAIIASIKAFWKYSVFSNKVLRIIKAVK